MPTHDASRYVNSAATLPGDEEWGGSATGLLAEEVAPISRDGTVHYGVQVSWRYDEDVPAKAFIVYYREADEPHWRYGAQVAPGANSAYVPGFYRAGAVYEFSVVVVGLNCCARETPETAPRVTITYHGVELVPDPPTGLVVDVRDGDVVATWEPIDYPGEIQYEVRVSGAENLEAAVTALRTRLTEVTIRDLPPAALSSASIVVSVVPVTGSGLRGPAAQTTVSPSPAPADVAAAVDLSAGGTWTGSKSGLLVVGSQLDAISGSTTCSFLAPIQDTGEVAERQVLLLLGAEIYNAALTWDTALFTWDGFEARRRTWDLGGLDVPAIPEVLDGRDGPTWDTVEGTWDSLYWMTWDSFAAGLTEDAPLTWDEARFTWDSPYAHSMTWDGPVTSSGAVLARELRFSDDNVTWTAWSPAVGQTATFRYWQARITLTRPSDAVGLTVSSLLGFLVRRGGAALDRSKSAGLRVTQASHGFSVGNAVYFNGSAYAKARSDAVGTVGRFIVAAVDGDDFVLVVAGYVTGLSGLAAGTLYYVDEATAGALRTTAPSAGNFANPILLAVSATAGWVLPLLPVEVV